MPATWGNDVCPFRPSGCPPRRHARSFPGPLRCLKPAQSPASAMTRRPFGGLMAGESAVFIAATAFSVRMIMEVSLMRSQNPMHGPCQRRKTLFNNGLVDLRSCRKSDIEGDAYRRRPICTSMSPFRIANRAPSAPEYFSYGDQHDVFMNGQCRTLCLCRTDRDVPLPSRSAVARAARSFALSCRCTGSIPTSSEAAIMKSDAISSAARPLSGGSNSLCWCRIDALDQMVADGRMPRPKRITDCAIWDLHQLDCRISVKIAGRQLRYDHSAGSKSTCAIRSLRLNPGGGMRPQSSLLRAHRWARMEPS